jgi:hypothetical protein
MKEYEKLKLYFKIEVIVDFLYEILNEKWWWLYTKESSHNLKH